MSPRPRNHAVSLCLLAAAALAFAVTLALCADVIAEHRAEYEVLLWRKHIERTGQHEPHRVETLALSEKEVHAVVAYGLQYITDVLPPQTGRGIVLVLLVEREQHHTANTFFVLVDVVHQHFHVWRQNFGLHKLYFFG